MTILRGMTATEKTVFLGLGALMVTLAASAVNPPSKAEEFSGIAKRNPFALVDPPPPVAAKVDEKPKTEADPPPNVELTGFFRNSRKGKTVALFLVEKKKGERRDSYMWAVGEGDAGMKVLAINEAEKTVKLSVRDVESTITFSKPKPGAAVPGAGMQPGGARRAPGAPGVPVAGAAGMNQGAQQFETSHSKTLGRSASSVSAVGGALPSQSATRQADALRSVPPRTLRVPGNTTQMGNQPQGGQAQMEILSPREQEVLIEVNRAVLQQSGQIGLQPPLPPTSLTTPEDRVRLIVPPGQGGYPQQ